MEMLFIRHGPPEFDSSRWLHQYDLKQLLREYYVAPVDTPAPVEQVAAVGTYAAEVVLCSTLSRSIGSANALGFPDAIEMSELDEADLPCPKWLSIPVPYQAAIVVLRIAWLVGYSRDCNSYRVTQSRASDAATKLIELANTHGRLLIVGHGIMNRMVCRALKQEGWSVDKQDHTGYWSMTSVRNNSRTNLDI